MLIMKWTTDHEGRLVAAWKKSARSKRTVPQTEIAPTPSKAVRPWALKLYNGLGRRGMGIAPPEQYNHAGAGDTMFQEYVERNTRCDAGGLPALARSGQQPERILSRPLQMGFPLPIHFGWPGRSSFPG